MRAVGTSAELRAATAAARQGGASVGFVATMGALHAGHRSLLAAARRDCGLVVASVYVNPLQFGPGEDLAGYPRDLPADLAVLEAEEVDLAFVPADGEIWASPPQVRLTVGGALGTTLEAARRPGHLDGVATVVAKLLHLVGPARAYFGRKDAQQLATIRRMVADLAFPHQVIGCPTVRAADGLALSSRNAYLSAAERAAAPALHRALLAAVAAWRAGARTAAEVEAAGGAALRAAPGVAPDYLALVDPEGFERVAAPGAGQLLVTAARVGPARLIDNLELD